MSSGRSAGSAGSGVETAGSGQRMAPAGRLRLTAGGSMLLDVVRFGAALVVLVHHWVGPQFTGSWPFVGEAGHEAVCVFFVLSGFMIRFVTRSRVGTPQDYLIDRASRLYSVVLPALGFTLLVELAVSAVDPAMRVGFRTLLPWRFVPMSLLQNIFFTQQCWGFGLPALSDTPFWSLSFEVFYYIAYGLLHYRARWGWAAVCLLFLVGGPAIALLAPIWWLGCWTCDLYLHWRRRPDGGVAWSGALLAGLLAVLIGLRRPILAVLHATQNADREAFLERLTAGWKGPDLHLFGKIMWLDSASPSYAIVGLLTAALLLFGLLAIDRWRPSASEGAARRVRFVAEGTFALYLLHVPMLELVVGLIGRPVRSRAGGLAMLLGILVVCVLAAAPLNRLKDWMRLAMRGWTRRAPGV